MIRDIYERCGRDRAAMVSEVIRYRGKSALRDVGKVFGLARRGRTRERSRIAEPTIPLSDSRLREAGIDPADKRVQRVFEVARAIYKAPRHLSIHVSGFVISAAPLVEIAPIEPATMPGRTVIPWTKTISTRSGSSRSMSSVLEC